MGRYYCGRWRESPPEASFNGARRRLVARLLFEGGLELVECTLRIANAALGSTDTAPRFAHAERIFDLSLRSRLYELVGLPDDGDFRFGPRNCPTGIGVASTSFDGTRDIRGVPDVTLSGNSLSAHLRLEAVVGRPHARGIGCRVQGCTSQLRVGSRAPCLAFDIGGNVNLALDLRDGALISRRNLLDVVPYVSNRIDGFLGLLSDAIEKTLRVGRRPDAKHCRKNNEKPDVDLH